METHFANLEGARLNLAKERVLEDLRQLSRDAEALLQATAHDVSEKAREARERLAQALEKAKATCAELEEGVLARAKDAARRADSVIRQHPYESIGLAFAVGLLLGVLLGRK
ncbi:MAG: DUF883 family protein [Verrucomicrobiota bacterium]|nr:DUF883 family protein [Limisphaera sp.]MDW8382225.1 DUF883 family protein [Verrucomicrobiota bacterium]